MDTVSITNKSAMTGSTVGSVMNVKTPAMITAAAGSSIPPVIPEERIQIHIAKHLAATHTENAALLMPHLECSVKRFDVGGEYGVLQWDEIQRLYYCDQDLFQFPAGCVPRIADILTRQGHNVVTRDFTRWAQLTRASLSRSRNDALGAVTPDLLTAVAASPRGQLVVRRRFRAEVAGYVCEVFPAASILIVVTNREEEQHFASRLAEQLGRPVYSNANRNFSPTNKVFIVTTSIFSCVSDLDWDIIIFTSPRAAVARQSFERASFLEDQLLFCITPPGYQPDRYTQLRLESICGPEIWNEAEPRAAVHVALAKSSSATVQPCLAGLARKSQAVWHDHQRNDGIADLATAIVTSDARTSSRRSESLRGHLALIGTHCPRAVILVESPAHGRELAKRLPDWELITGIPDKDGCIDEATGPNHMEIITEAIAASDGIDADVIVVASGLVSAARNFPPQRERPVLILDFADKFDEQAREATQQRIEDYTQRGWTVHSEVVAPEGGER